MSKKKRFGVSQALSRGLSDTIHVVENNLGIFRNTILSLSRIELDPDNPRKLAITLADIQQGINKNDALYERKLAELDKLKELANTIESSGVINPIVGYKRGDVYRVVAGERRCLASILAGKNEIEARVFNDKPRGFELKLIQWIENTAREDLTLDERIGNIHDLIQEYRRQQNNEVAVTATLLKNITGLSLPQATYYMTVLNAPLDVKQVIESGKIRSLDKAAIIAGIESSEIRREALQACIDGCSLKELRKIVAQGKQTLRKETLINVKRGRAVTRVNMGFTLNSSVVQAIVESVLSQIKYKKYSDMFLKIDWSHFEQASRAFKKLVEILEQEIVR
ncbi:MAG TPA: ParB/RepB/Spo0J family partition protein [Gammaproteobacteria bacterium]|nr:ParB/RepB/Spo0J family partition protein [Gammaproteobacteria bacterium]